MLVIPTIKAHIWFWFLLLRGWSFDILIRLMFSLFAKALSGSMLTGVTGATEIFAANAPEKLGLATRP